MNALHTLTACLALALPACGPEAPTDSTLATAAPPSDLVAAADAAPASPYRFDQPTARFELPDALREISALTVLPDGSLGAVQDEDGELYVLSAETGRVTSVVPFGPPGDYEGVELAGDRLFVLRADGALLELQDWASGEARTTVYDTDLGAKRCDAEGLGHDASAGHLLIACKEEDDDGLNRVYAFDLATNALAPEPAVVLDPDAVEGDKKLRPSALAVHSLTGQTVVLSSKRESLVVLRADGTAAAVWDLGPANFEQPEGLAFLPNGDALISSEGGDGPAVLLRFAYAPAR